MLVPMAILAALCLGTGPGQPDLLLPLLDRVVSVLAPEAAGLLVPGLRHGPDSTVRDAGPAGPGAGLACGLWLLRSQRQAARRRRGLRPGTAATPDPRCACSTPPPPSRTAGLPSCLGSRSGCAGSGSLFPKPVAYRSEFQDPVGERFVEPRIERLAERLLRYRQLQHGPSVALHPVHPAGAAGRLPLDAAPIEAAGMILYGLAVLLTALSGVPGLLLRKQGGAVAAAVHGPGSRWRGWRPPAGPCSAGPSGSWTCPRTPLGSLGLLRFDPIAAFFLIPMLLLCRLRLDLWPRPTSATPTRAPGGSGVLYGLTTAFLALLVAAAHAFTFLLAWEGMAITAFLLVITEDRNPETQRAGWIYLIATHAGTLCLFGAFALMASTLGSFAFAGFSSGFAATGRGTLTFLLFLLGFGIKAGHLPLPLLAALRPMPPRPATSPRSCPACFIKMGILGLVRFLSWIPDPPLWWGGLLVVLGAALGHPRRGLRPGPARPEAAPGLPLHREHRHHPAGPGHRHPGQEHRLHERAGPGLRGRRSCTCSTTACSRACCS